MQTQDAPAEILFKLWPWLEANRNRLIGGLVAIVVIAGIGFFISSQRAARQVAAGEALTLILSTPSAATGGSELAASLEQLATTYAGTGAGERARLQAAGALFAAGNYQEASAQFQKCLDADGSGPFAATAELGVGSCLEAQNQLDAAAAAYQRILSLYPGSPVVTQAQFGLGRVAEEQNKLSDAVSYYEKVVSAAMGGTLAQEAALRASELKLKLAAATPKPSGAPQFGAPPNSKTPTQPNAKP